MIDSKSGVKIHSVWKCRKCGTIQRWWKRGPKPKQCYMKSCLGEMKRKA